MADTAHIFTPKDDTLKARAEAYRQVYQAWLNAESSLKFLEDDEWSDTLGDREEVERALSISIHSLQVAADAFTKEEIAEARKAQLIEDHEALELIQSKRQQESQAMWDNEDEDQDSDSFGCTR